MPDANEYGVLEARISIRMFDELVKEPGQLCDQNFTPFGLLYGVWSMAAKGENEVAWTADSNEYAWQAWPLDWMGDFPR